MVRSRHITRFLNPPVRQVGALFGPAWPKPADRTPSAETQEQIMVAAVRKRVRKAAKLRLDTSASLANQYPGHSEHRKYASHPMSRAVVSRGQSSGQASESDA